MDIGDIIKRELMLRDMKQIDLAKKLGMTEVTISRYINGTRTPKATTLKKIADALDVPTSIFYNDPQRDINVYQLIIDMIKINTHSFTNDQKYRIICELTK